MRVAIRQIGDGRDLDAFIRFPLHLYRNDAHFVPPLIRERKRFFDRSRNPLFAFTEAAYFLARDPRGRPVGRISAHVNQRHIRHWDEAAGFFGFFESTDDAQVANALLDAAENWLRGHGMALARGPCNFSTNDECGFLVEGFDRDPAVMMPYTKPYYPAMVERAGYTPARDLMAYEISPGEVVPERLARIGRRVAARGEVNIRPLDMRRFEEEVAAAFAVYNAAWSRNWGFVPMTEAEFGFTAEGLKSVIDPATALVAESGEQTVGFALCLPDINPILKRLQGRLGPWGLVRFLLGKRRLVSVRFLVLGVVDTHRKRGIETALTYRMWRNVLDRGYHRPTEMSWILDDNELMKRAIDRVGGVLTKRYRIYDKAL